MLQMKAVANAKQLEGVYSNAIPDSKISLIFLYQDQIEIRSISYNSAGAVILTD